MKKALLAILLILSLMLTACHTPEERYVTCEEILSAYEGVDNIEIYHPPHTTDGKCQIYLNTVGQEMEDYLYFNVYPTFEEADARAQETNYNGLVWLFGLIYGEPRMLKVGTFGNVEYEYFNSELFAPFEELMRETGK